MKRSPLKRTMRKGNGWASKETLRVVFLRTRGRCCCGCGRSIAPVPIGYHHVFARKRWPELADEPRAIVGVAEECHANHESAYRRLPRAALAVAETLPLTPQMGAYLDRVYGPEPGGVELVVPASPASRGTTQQEGEADASTQKNTDSFIR